jgi:hypothetical protein
VFEKFSLVLKYVFLSFMALYISLIFIFSSAKDEYWFYILAGSIFFACVTYCFLFKKDMEFAYYTAKYGGGGISFFLRVIYFLLGFAYLFLLPKMLGS